MKRTRGHGWVLVTLLVGLLQLAAWAGSEPPGSFIDQFKQVPISTAGSRNLGEVEGWKQMIVHPYNAYQNLAIQIQQIKDTDAEGGIVHPDFPGNTWSLTAATTRYDGPPNGPGCYDHEAKFQVLNIQDYGVDGSYHMEASLLKRVAFPGRYRFRFIWDGDGSGTAMQPSIWEFSRMYNVFPPLRYVNFKVRNKAGVAIEGVNLNTVPNRPYPVGRPLGTTAALGDLRIPMCPQQYELSMTKAGNTTQYAWVTITDLPVDQDRNIDLVFATGSESLVPSKGTLGVHCEDSTDKKAVKGASLRFGSDLGPVEAVTDVMGQAFFTRDPTTATLFATKPGYVTQYKTVSIYSASASQVLFTMVRSSTYTPDPVEPAPGGGGGGGFPLTTTWWEDLFKLLFVPKTSTLQQWNVFREQLMGWGPLGAVTSFWQAWSTATRQGEVNAVWSMTLQPWGGASGGISGELDWRAAKLSGESSYVSPPGRGSQTGTWLAGIRQVAGWAVWVLWCFGLYRWLKPKLVW